MSDASRIERWTFLVEASDAPDQLLRVLNPLVVIGARLAAATLARSPDGVTIRLDTEDLDERRAETLRRRLQALPGVMGVSMAWQAAPPTRCAA